MIDVYNEMMRRHAKLRALIVVRSVTGDGRNEFDSCTAIGDREVYW